MKTAQDTIQASTQICGDCEAENATDAKFCEGCGHHLSEPCSDCGNTVALTQKFCEKCGCNLAQITKLRYQQYANKLTDALKQTKLHEYEHAIDLLENIRKLADYRFRSISEKAIVAMEKIECLRIDAAKDTTKNIKLARVAAARDDDSTVVSLLKNVPKALRDADAEKTLLQATRRLEEKRTLQNALRKGITDKNWRVVGDLLEQLITNSPNEVQYQELAQKVSERLVKHAKRSAVKADFCSAVESLKSIPAHSSTPEIAQLSTWVSKLRWCADQVKNEPFATTALQHIAHAVAKSASKCEAAAAESTELSSRIKAKQTTGRCPLPRWKATNECWLGGEVSLLGLPQAQGLGKHEALREKPGQFNIAIGLALQGLGHGRIKGQFANPKKKLLGSRRKKTSRCWGLDIGSATIKAVLLNDDGGRITITDSFFEELPTPSCRKSTSENTRSTLLLPTLMKFAREKNASETCIWAGFPASEIVTHFVSIPTLKEKLTQQIIENELAQKVPLPRTEIEVVQWIGTPDPENSKGRPVTLSIARKQSLNEYSEMLDMAGIAISGLQCNSLALLNFAEFEFPELRQSEPATPSTAERAIAFLDCGASATTLLVASNQTHWFCTMETGSEALNSLIARQAKVTVTEAEKLKRNPAFLADPAEHYAGVEKSFLVSRARLETAVRDMQSRNEQLEISSTWCMGGGSLTHQWIRLVTTQERSS